METRKIYKVEAVIRPEAGRAERQALYHRRYGMTVSDVYGCGLTRGQKEIFRGKVIPINLMPKVKVEIVIFETPLQKLIDTIREVCNSGRVGDGKIFVSELVTAVKIRTGEMGGDAVIDNQP